MTPEPLPCRLLLHPAPFAASPKLRQQFPLLHLLFLKLFHQLPLPHLQRLKNPFHIIHPLHLLIYPSPTRQLRISSPPHPSFRSSLQCRIHARLCLQWQ
ncbi:hypothetical protein D6C95_10553 [Aureobasidium pullulans]|nr:hypothetical protein D6C95_10553 [Aureobasidium pullulans]